MISKESIAELKENLYKARGELANLIEKIKTLEKKMEEDEHV